MHWTKLDWLIPRPVRPGVDAPGGTASRRARALVLAWSLAIMLVMTLLPLRAGASEVPDSQTGADASGVRRTGERFVPPEGASDEAFWIHHALRRAFVLNDFERNTHNNDVASDGWVYGRTLTALDLDSGKPLGSVELSPPAFSTDGGNNDGRIHVDQQGGRLFIPYVIPDQQRYQRLVGADSWASDTTGHAASDGNVCASVEGVNTYQTIRCVGGVHVLDAETLEVQHRLDLRPIRADGFAGWAPILRAVSFSPPQEDEGGDGKVYLLVEQMGHHANAVSARTRQFGQFGATFAVQFDLATGQQEWAVRVAPCRGTRDDDSDPQPRAQLNDRPYPAAIYRSDRRDEVWVGCNHGSARATVMVRIPLDEQSQAPGLAPARASAPDDDSDPTAEPSPDGVVAREPALESWVGPEAGIEFRVDRPSGRTVVRANPEHTELWWVFDEAERSFIGAIGIGEYHRKDAIGGLDERTGRLYVFADPAAGLDEGGLFVADLRRTPLPQALRFPQFTERVPMNRGLQVFSPGGDEPRRVYRPVAKGGKGSDQQDFGGSWEIFEDSTTVSLEEEREAVQGRTLDLPEAEGVTGVSLDGAARGFGARAILIGGVAAAARTPLPADADATYGRWRNGTTATNAQAEAMDRCGWSQREVVVGFVGPDTPASVDDGGSRGSAQPVLFDGQTSGDVQAPVSRCAGQVHNRDGMLLNIGLPDVSTPASDWGRLWSAVLFGQPPVDEPGAPATFTSHESHVTCVSGQEDEQSQSWRDPFVQAFHAQVECSEESAGGMSEASGLNLDNLSVTEAVSRYRIFRDPERGIVSRVESVARGIDIDGLIKIDTIRGTAESWANGRANDTEEADPSGGSGPAANCDRSRMAGTCFERHFAGVWIGDGLGGTAYRCGPCGDEDALVEALDNALGAEADVRLRHPDPALARGSSDGYVAAIQKPDAERFADLTLNNDVLQTTLPALEIIRYAPGGAPAQGAYIPERGKQIFQFAGVEVSSKYAIECLLVYDAEANTCTEAPEQLGSISVELTDPDGAPLEGGAFEVRRDVDSDGVVGLLDELLPDGACVTGEDGIGTCTFDGLAAGPYLVSQTAAPDGYSAVTEPWVSELAPGEARTVTFTNASNLSTIEIAAEGPGGQPVAGAVFAVFADPDADGKIGPEAQPVATCTTDASGECAMTVPAGSYVLVQTAAPAGLDPVDPVAFAFASGGQTAAVGVVNQPAGAVDGSGAPAAASPIAYTDPPALSPPSESVLPYTAPEAVEEPRVSVPEQVGGTVVRVIRAPGDALRLLSRDPKQAVAWTAALGLLALAVLSVRRRYLLGSLLIGPAVAFAGTPPPRLRPPSATPDRSDPARPTGEQFMAVTSVHSASQAGTSVLDRPTVAGAAPASSEWLHVKVVLATASPVLAALVTGRLASAERVDMLATVDSIDELRPLLRTHKTNVVIIDMALPTGGPLDICDVLPSLHAPARTVGLIPPGRSIDALAIRGYQVGLGGLLVAEEDLGNGHLAYAVRAVAAGKPCYGPAAAAALVEHWERRPRQRGKHPVGLTDRELEIARLAATGASRSQIAEALYISPVTVKAHLRTLRAKLGVTDPRDSAQLRRRLEDVGLLKADDDRHV